MTTPQDPAPSAGVLHPSGAALPAPAGAATPAAPPLPPLPFPPSSPMAGQVSATTASTPASEAAVVKGETMLHHSVSSVAHAWAYLFAHPESIMKFFQIVQTGIAIYQASGGHVSKQVIKDITLAAVVANAMGVEPVSATP